MAPRRGAANPALVRAALETGEDVPVEAEGPDSRSMVHVVAAIGLGVEEVGADALAEAFAAFGMYGLTVEDWAQMLGAAERGEKPAVDWGPLERHALRPKAPRMAERLVEDIFTALDNQTKSWFRARMQPR